MKKVFDNDQHRKTILNDIKLCIKEGKVNKLDELLKSKNINPNIENFGLIESIENNNQDFVKYFKAIAYSRRCPSLEGHLWKIARNLRR